MVEENSAALVIGASGGIGNALATKLVESGQYQKVFATARSAERCPDGTEARALDLAKSEDFEALAAEIKAEKLSLTTVIVASGVLHIGEHGPEKSLRSIEPDFMAQTLMANTIGPALALKHFTPLMPRKGRSVFAALSARVGSISDNRLGGWYSYRASKAALNMVIKTASLEIARTKPELVCVGLHPGTVDTDLSKPFQAGVPEGKLFTADYSATALLKVLDGLAPEQSGKCFAFDGTEVPA